MSETPSGAAASPPPAERPRPLDLLDVLDHVEVATGPDSSHAEILTRAGKIGLLRDGPADAERVLVACGGALGGLLGPAGGLYHHLARTLATCGVATIRVDYRRPGALPPCVLDLGVAIDLAHRQGGDRFVIVGHSFGGAVAIGAGAALTDLVVGVVSLAGQSAGCEPAAALTEIPLLFVHGDRDEIIPAESATAVRRVAGHGEIVLLPRTGHLLTESTATLHERLPGWILRAFDGDPGSF